MTNIVDKFIKYPIYPRQLSWFEEKIMLKTSFGGFAKCSVCGSFCRIHVKGENLRETCICSKCKSTNRQRQIAYVVCHAIGLLKKMQISSLEEFKKLNNFIIYNTEAKGPLHDQLFKTENYICSEYFGSCYKSGEIVKNIMHQDLMNLSLKDKSVDLIISSDVFEHIPDPYRAHEEVYRILKTGGRHIFTVPFHQTEFLDEERTFVDNNGNNVYLKEPLYHQDPLRPEGALVYKIFSLEMLIKLRKIGFRTNLYHLYNPWFGIWGSNAIVFEAIKEENSSNNCMG